MRRGSNCSSSVAPFLLFYQLFTSTARLQGPGIASPWITGFSHTGDGASLWVLRQWRMKREITASFLSYHPTARPGPLLPQTKVTPLPHVPVQKRYIIILYFISHFLSLFLSSLEDIFFFIALEREEGRERNIDAREKC